MKKKLILLSGPSCVGKGPLLAALKTFHPEIAFSGIPVIRSRGSRNNVPRPEEKPIWDDPDFFMPDAMFSKLDKNYVTGKVHGFPQAIDLRKITEHTADLLILEIYYTFWEQFKKRDAETLDEMDITSVFMSPVSQNEIDLFKEEHVSKNAFIVEMMLEKQMRRAEFMGLTVTSAVSMSFNTRAQSAPNEINVMDTYDYRIICHDGEGHPNWNRNRDGSFHARPAGEAGNALDEFVGIIGDV
jgi:guanylate kinase